MEQTTESCKKSHKSYFNKLSDQFWNKPMKVKDLLNPPQGQPQWKGELIAILRLAARDGHLTGEECYDHFIYSEFIRNNALYHTKNDFELLKVLDEKLYAMDPEEYL